MLSITQRFQKALAHKCERYGKLQCPAGLTARGVWLSGLTHVRLCLLSQRLVVKFACRGRTDVVVTVQHSVNHRAVAQALAKNRGGHEKSALKVGMTTRGIDIFLSSVGGCAAGIGMLHRLWPRNVFVV